MELHILICIFGENMDMWGTPFNMEKTAGRGENIIIIDLESTYSRSRLSLHYDRHQDRLILKGNSGSPALWLESLVLPGEGRQRII